MAVWKILTCIKEGFCIFVTFYFLSFRKERSCSACECPLSWLASRGFLSKPIIKSIHLQSPLKKWILHLQDLFQYFIMVTNSVTSIEYQLCAPNANTVEVCDQYLKFLFQYLPFVLFMPCILDKKRDIIWSTDEDRKEPNSGLWTVTHHNSWSYFQHRSGVFGNTEWISELVCPEKAWQLRLNLDIEIYSHLLCWICILKRRQIVWI